jgi:chromosome segregation ATPase
MNKEKAKAAFEKMCKCSDPDLLESFWHIYLAGAEWASNDWEKSFNEVIGNLHEEYEKLQTELDWHKKELARVDHALVDACDRANKLQAELNDYKQGADVEGREADRLRADLKSVNFSYWKKCEELSQLQEQNSKLRECVEFYADDENWDEEHTGWGAILTYCPLGNSKAKQCLKEIEGE